MPFEPGARLGPYEIIGPIGAGGMGEIYRGRDTRLDRIVAIKVLSGGLASDPEARQRFEQEARAIAALNDPHICTIHDVGQHGDLDYLVLEYLEGETLDDRLKRTPELSLGETLAIAIQIGEALDRAHSAGIVHRDLKPGNVMLVRRGSSGAPEVKLLDFGLAARTAPTRSAADPTLGATIAAGEAPTVLTAPASTSGFSGTVQYMAPEQLSGDQGDHRADIFAFGCVLYEMLARRKAFVGGNALSVIAAITESEPPPIASLQSAPLLDHVLRRCLEKDRERRWQSMRDITAELRWIAAQPAAAPASTGRSSLAARLAIPGALLVLAAVIAGVLAFGPRRTPPELPALRLEISTAATDDPSMALSPDGTRIAFIANRDRVPVLWVRSLDSLESRPMATTERASLPFWSPDGATIGFFADGRLKRIDVAGGTAIDVTSAPNARGGAWSPDGVILFSSGIGAPIMRVSTRGGAAERVTELDARTGPDHRWPQFLPDGKRFLFSSTLGTPETNGVYIGSLDKTPPVRVVAGDGPSSFAAPDRLLTIQKGTLLAYSFDQATGTVRGEPAVIAQGFGGASASGGFTTSETGVLAYRSGTAQRRQLVWTDGKGDVLGTIGEPQTDFLSAPELSADGRSVAVFTQRSGDNDIWVIELARNLARRITDGPPADAHPLWDPDGLHVVFFSRRFGGGAARQPLAGGAPEPLFANHTAGMPLSWTRDRAHLATRREGAKTGSDLIAVTTNGPPREIVVAQSAADETEAQFSPDGRWIALVSNESGRPEVFVQAFPSGQSRTQVSTAGGSQVRWSNDGATIFFIAPDARMMSASIAFGKDAPEPRVPVPLFQTRLATGTNVLGNKPQYAVARDGRFLLNTAVEGVTAPITVAVNWMPKAAR